MFECKICKKELDGLRSISPHLQWNHKGITSEEYYRKYINASGCEICGKRTTFVSIGIGIKRFCGAKCSALSPDTIAARKKTCLKNHGVENISQLGDIKKKKEETCLKNHGVTQYQKSPILREKFKRTMNKKYGVDHPTYIMGIQSRKEKTCLKNHGEKYPGRLKHIRDQNREKRLEIGYESVVSLATIEALFGKSDYIGVKSNDVDHIEYPWKCKECGLKFESIIKYRTGVLWNPRCPKCNPPSSSLAEKEVFRFTNSIIHSEPNKYFTKDGKRFELDIFIPSKNLGIEFNGIYWHSEVAGKDRKYHIDKSNWFKENFDIDIIHIFEGEWEFRQEIVKSIIRNRLGLNTRRIFARKCKVVNLTPKQYRDFLNENHIQGAMNSSVKLGLEHDGEVVSIIGIGKSRFDKKDVSMELHRYCNKLNTSVVGGFSKLLKHSGVVGRLTTFCDRRYFSGDGYKAVGFDIIGNTKPNYWYFKGTDLILHNRIQFQKHKLKDKLERFDHNLTEWENMQNNGWNRIWDCGNVKLEKLILDI